MNAKLFLALLSFCTTCYACASSDHTDTDNVSPGTGSNKKVWKNPVVAKSLPDPTVVRGTDGYFYLYATEDIYNVPIMKSKNLVQWTDEGTVFTNDTRPTFVKDGGVWAPDANYVDGKYVLFYSMSTWGGEWECGIGVATADNPAGPFTNHGKLFISSEIGVQNSIDPCLVQEGEAKYLVWGSFRGIYYVELNKDCLSVKEGAKPQQIAGTAFEGTYIHKHGDYYYLFASVGSCCEGANSTYKLVVGRSKELWGTYVNKDGQSMMDNGYTLVVGPNAHFLGNGHCSQIVTDDDGQDWILYHGYQASDPDAGRVLILDSVQWSEDGWPFVKNASPTYDMQPYPVFN